MKTKTFTLEVQMTSEAGEVEGAGGRINAYTSFDVTVYYATLPSTALETGLDVLVDAVRHSIFDPLEVHLGERATCPVTEAQPAAEVLDRELLEPELRNRECCA